MTNSLSFINDPINSLEIYFFYSFPDKLNVFISGNRVAAILISYSIVLPF
jgi:hypothetical protein